VTHHYGVSQSAVERAELEDRREKWSEDLRLRKPVDGESSEEEEDDDSCGGGAGGAEEEKAVKAAAERQAEAVARLTVAWSAQYHARG
jgi:hypothetical protein